MLKQSKFLILLVVLFSSKAFSEAPVLTFEHKTDKLSITNSEPRLEVYEPAHKLWVAYVGGKISPDLDVFGKEFKTNVFTTLGVDF